MSGALTHGQRKAGVGVDRVKRERDDFYPTPPEATRALLSVEIFDGAVWEPACGDGAISRELEAAGYEVVSSDLIARGYGESAIDFLMEWQPRAPNIVTNPPFKHCAEFMRHAASLASGKVAMIMRLAALEGAERREIYESTPLARVWVFSRRLTMHRSGKPVSENGGMVAFAWFVWERGYTGRPVVGWL